jgi:hypothetical protein
MGTMAGMESMSAARRLASLVVAAGDGPGG